jgi:hypothetical protein
VSKRENLVEQLLDSVLVDWTVELPVPAAVELESVAVVAESAVVVVVAVVAVVEVVVVVIVVVAVVAAAAVVAVAEIDWWYSSTKTWDCWSTLAHKAVFEDWPV